MDESLLSDSAPSPTVKNNNTDFVIGNEKYTWMDDPGKTESNETKGLQKEYAKAYALFVQDYMWKSPCKINVYLYPTTRQDVEYAGGMEYLKQVVSLFPNMGVKFQYVSDINKSHIRVAFELGEGNWSYVGTACLEQSSLNRRATMNIMNFDKRTILHEFCHALGMEHEFQMEGVMNWNKEAVYNDLEKPPNNWSRDLIDEQMFKVVPRYNSVGVFDIHSIMQYPIPKHWTNDGVTIPLNTDLSELDKEWLLAAYPLPSNDVEENDDTVYVEHGPRPSINKFRTNTSFVAFILIIIGIIYYIRTSKRKTGLIYRPYSSFQQNMFTSY
tara:strand:+ start:35 stop:1015 length:981 start_codon:yes stop_codon:yes gene_type:complete